MTHCNTRLSSAAWTAFACLASAIALPAACLHAQEPLPSTQRTQMRFPAPTPNDTLQSVEVQPDRQVRFRIWAPNATDVKLESEGPEATPGIKPDELAKFNDIAMVKGDQGIWETVIGPIEPGVYLYNFVVDGVKTPDPRNPIFAQTLNAQRSIYEVPGAAFSEYNPDIAHGDVHVVYYNSKAIGGMRRMHIYTPPGYENGTQRFPVLYLLHGAGGTDDSWSAQGRAGAILDNLIAAHKAVPMIVVMPAGHVSRDLRAGAGTMGHDAFNKDLVEDVMPYVDSHYRTLTDRDHRALAGLSMGGMQTLSISLRNSADFGWVGVFSAGWMAPALKEAQDVDLTEYRAGGKPFHLYWFAIGQYDFLLDTCHQTVDLLNKNGIKAELHESGGFHAWTNWRSYLNQFAPQLFQPAAMKE
jgi:enterochelin esterase-like enzyme